MHRKTAPSRLVRTVLHTSRLLDFASQKELTAQTGHPVSDWPLVALKELTDNSLDACEESRIAPVIAVTVNKHGISVRDNGPGMPESIIDGVCDFSARVSSREAYVAPDRGAQGNALKTILAMPYVLDGQSGWVEIESRGVRHTIAISMDRIRQTPVIERDRQTTKAKPGTTVLVRWPNSASLIESDANARILQIGIDDHDEPCGLHSVEGSLSAKLNLATRGETIFANHLGLRLAESTSDDHRGLVRD